MRASCAYKLAIFDYDGTLVDSAPWLGGVINEVARRYRFKQVEPGEFESLRDHDVGALLRHLDVARWKLPFIARHMRKLAARDSDQIKLHPGIPAALRTIRKAGVNLALVSSNARNNVEHTLGPDLAALFDHYACGASVFGKAKKFRQVLKASGHPAASVVAIGDEMRDIEAARSVGIDSAAVAWGYADPAALAHKTPTLMFERIEDMADELTDGPPAALIDRNSRRTD